MRKLNHLKHIEDNPMLAYDLAHIAKYNALLN